MRIVTAVDFSDLSDKVLEQAVNVAKKEGAELTILTIGEDFRDAEMIQTGAVRGEEKLLDMAKDRAKRAKAIADARGVDAEIVVERHHSPAESIVNLATEKNADLIVMGHKTKKGLRFLVGGNVSKVVEHAPCSVLVVK